MISLATAFLAVSAQPIATDVLLLADRGGKFVLERRALEEGRELELLSSSATGLVDVLLPVGPGRSGSIESLAGQRTLRVRAEQGVIHASTELAGGRIVQRPERRLDELARETVYLCVQGAGGRRAAFLVRGSSVEELEDGPFLDLFSGRIPLGPQDYSVTTDTRSPQSEEAWIGEIELRVDGWILVHGRIGGGPELTFALDLGAGTSLIARGALPAGTHLEEAGIVRYQGGVRREERYSLGGASGSIGGLAGQARLASLSLGSAQLHDADVSVLESLPELGGKHVDGILGLDLLQRARRLRLDFGARRLVLGAPALEGADGSARCLLLASHLFVGGRLAGSPWQWLVDTGSPRTILDEAAVKTAGLRVAREAGAAGGLDGAKRRMQELEPCAPFVGQQPLAPAPLLTADLEVFATWRSPGAGLGLLGNDLLRGLGVIEFDLEQGRMSWKATEPTAR